MDGCRLPSPAQKRIEPLEDEEVSKLAAAMPAAYYTLPLILDVGGLRIGEALGLQRRDVDVDLGVLRVERSLCNAVGLVLRPTKTGQMRAVPFGPSLLEAILEHLDEFVGPGPESPLFATSQGGLVDHANMMRTVWRPAATTAGVPANPHALRHTCASLLIAGGASIKAVADFLGHADPTVTLRTYAHLYPGDLGALGASLATLWTESEDASRVSRGVFAG